MNNNNNKLAQIIQIDDRPLDPIHQQIFRFFFWAMGADCTERETLKQFCAPINHDEVTKLLLW